MSTASSISPTSLASRPAPPPAAPPRSPLARVAAIGVGGFAVAAAVTGLITPGYQVRREAMSALAALDAPYAELMIGGFLAAAVGLTCAGLSLWRTVPARAGRIASALIVAAGALMAVAGLARQDCSDQLPTCKDFGEAAGASTSYWIHQNASLLLFVLLTASFFVLARGLRRSGVRTDLAPVSRIAGVFAVLTIALIVVGPPVLASSYGIVQRVFLAILFGWPVAAAFLTSRPVMPAAR